MLKTLVIFAASALPLPVLAQEIITHDFRGSFEDATFALENAIIGEGLVIDHVSHVGDMLERTAADVGSETKLFEGADVFLFCSATTSREVMEADPANIAFCPYAIYAATREGSTTIGYRSYGRDSMAPVNDLLERIATTATE